MFDYASGNASLFAGHARRCPHTIVEKQDDRLICIDCGEDVTDEMRGRLSLAYADDHCSAWDEEENK